MRKWSKTELVTQRDKDDYFRDVGLGDPSLIAVTSIVITIPVRFTQLHSASGVISPCCLLVEGGIVYKADV